MRFEQIVRNIDHESNPPYGTTNTADLLNDFCCDHRIASEGYPPSEAEYYDIEEWEQNHPGEDFETLFRESLADAT